MQRIIVDLPEPDGPQMTMRSPRLTVRLMSRSTWNSPYHLCMPEISMATSFVVVCMRGTVLGRGAAPVGCVALSLIPSSDQRMFRRGGYRFADKNMHNS